MSPQEEHFLLSKSRNSSAALPYPKSKNGRKQPLLTKETVSHSAGLTLVSALYLPLLARVSPRIQLSPSPMVTLRRPTTCPVVPSRSPTPGSPLHLPLSTITLHHLHEFNSTDLGMALVPNLDRLIFLHLMGYPPHPLIPFQETLPPIKFVQSLLNKPCQSWDRMERVMRLLMNSESDMESSSTQA